MVRSDWSKEWPSPDLVTRTVSPGVSLDEIPEAPLLESDKILQWDAKQGIRVRK
jgi:hypothetical protein